MAADTNLTGRTVGTCTLQSLVGRGGMGAVYLAQQSRPRRTVAVKVFMPGLLQDATIQNAFLIRFRREADAIAALDHVNIMPIYEYGEQEDLAYLVMPYVAGGTLRRMLEKRGVLPLNDTVSIVDQVAAGLDYAHARGIIHRDLKPGNIVFHADGRVVLTDFGIAKILTDTPEINNEALLTLTGTGMVIGTPEYFSPEQASGSQVDRRTDIYSLGIMLYQMLGGRVPFTGTTPVAIAVKHTVELPAPLSQLNRAISPGVEAVVMKALAKKPEQRYDSAGEMARALHAATNTPSQPAQPPAHEEAELGAVTLMSSDLVSSSRTVADPVLEESSEATTPVSFPQIQPGRNSGRINTPITPSIRERPERRRGYLSSWMAIMGTALAIILIVGGYFTYTNFLSNHSPSTASSSSNSSRANATSTPVAHATSTASSTGTSGHLPKALVPVENLLYGTTLPVCDVNSKLWNASSNAHAGCTTTGLTLTNTGGGSLAGVFLNALPNSASYPTNYVVQVQAVVNNASSGGFGVYFRNQPGQTQGAFAFLVYPAQNRWTANYYASKTGASSPLFSNGLTTSIAGTITIDVVVQGDTFQFYINGQKQGGVVSPTFPTGTIGLAADTGANVSFKNLALYAAPPG